MVAVCVCFPSQAKSGLGVREVMEAVVARVPPPPPRTKDSPTRALIFDSCFDAYKGVIVYFRVMDGAGIARERRLPRALSLSLSLER